MLAGRQEACLDHIINNFLSSVHLEKALVSKKATKIDSLLWTNRFYIITLITGQNIRLGKI